MPVTRHDTPHRKRRELSLLRFSPVQTPPSTKIAQSLNSRPVFKVTLPSTRTAPANKVIKTGSSRPLTSSFAPIDTAAKIANVTTARATGLKAFFNADTKTFPGSVLLPVTGMAFQFTLPKEPTKRGDLTPKPIEGIKEQVNAPTTRAVNPTLSAYNVGAIIFGGVNRFRLEYHRIGDSRRFGQRWSSTDLLPKDQRRTGTGADVIGSVTDVVGLAAGEHYVHTLQDRLANAKKTGDMQSAERLDRTILYARLGNLTTFASMGPTFWKWQDKNMKYSRGPRFATTFLKSAVMMDGIQEDLKHGSLNERSAAAYSFSALARMGVSLAKLMPGKQKYKLVEKITDYAYKLDAGMALAENLTIAGTHIRYGSAYPLDLWAETYKTIAPQAADKYALGLGRGVNWAMGGIGMHDANSWARKGTSVLTYDYTRPLYNLGNRIVSGINSRLIFPLRAPQN